MATIETARLRAIRHVRLAIRRYTRPSSGQSVGRQILHAARSIGLSTIGVKFVSLWSTIVVASFFGTGDDREAFLMAFLLPSVSIMVISGAAKSAMIPTYVRVLRQHGTAAAQALFSRVLLLAIGLLLFVATGLAVVLPLVLPILASGFDQSKQILTARLAYLLLPAIVAKGIGTLYGAALNAHHRFALVAAAPVMAPISMIALLVWWPDPSTRVYAMAVGTVVGVFAELAVLGWALKSRGMSLLPWWRDSGREARQIALQFLPLLAGAVMMSATDFVDRSMAASLSPGSLAALDYGNRLVIVILGVVSGAVGTAVLPHFSTLVQQRNWRELRFLLKVFGACLFVLMAVVAVLVVLLSETLIRVGLGRGAFTDGDVELVAVVQAAYALQMPFYVCGIMFVRVIASLTAGYVLAVGSCLNLALNVALNIAFMELWGVTGIALSTVCVYVFSGAFIMTMAYRLLRQRENAVTQASRKTVRQASP